jgi:hypothetical protein
VKVREYSDANGAADGGSAPVPAFGRAVALLAGTGARP